MRRLEGSRSRTNPDQQMPRPSDYYPDDREQYPEQSQQSYSPEIEEYERLQKKAREEYDREIRAIEATNPHSLYKEVITDPADKDVHRMTLFGRPVDLAMLENYLIFKVSPRTVTTLMRYNDVKAIEETRGLSKRKPLKMAKSGMIWIILGAVVLLIIGLIFFMYGGNMSEIMKGMFGGLGG